MTINYKNFRCFKGLLIKNINHYLRLLFKNRLQLKTGFYIFMYINIQLNVKAK